jgi:hypothetical protein
MISGEEQRPVEQENPFNTDDSSAEPQEAAPLSLLVTLYDTLINSNNEADTIEEELTYIEADPLVPLTDDDLAYDEEVEEDAPAHPRPSR